MPGAKLDACAVIRILKPLSEGAENAWPIIGVNEIKAVRSNQVFRFMTERLFYGGTYVTYGSIIIQSHDDV